MHYRFDLSLKKDYLHQNNIFKKSPFTLDMPFSYHAVLLDILIQSIEGEEAFTINVQKVKNAFSLEYLFNILLEKDDFLEQNREQVYSDEEDVFQYAYIGKLICDK